MEQERDAGPAEEHGAEEGGGRSRRLSPPKPPSPKQLARALRPRERDKDTSRPESAAPGPAIRRARSRDLAAVVALRALMFSAMGTPAERLSANEWQASTLRWLQVNLGEDDVNITVADVNGSVVACAIGEVVDRVPSPGNPRGRVGMLGNVATFPEYRMTGLGQACIDAVMTWFRDETDATAVELFATRDGRRRYLSHGFTDHEYPHMRVAIDRS